MIITLICLHFVIKSLIVDFAFFFSKWSLIAKVFDYDENMFYHHFLNINPKLQCPCFVAASRLQCPCFVAAGVLGQLSSRRQKDQKQMLVSLATIYVAFLLTWLPYAFIVLTQGLKLDVYNFMPLGMSQCLAMGGLGRKGTRVEGLASCFDLESRECAFYI